MLFLILSHTDRDFVWDKIASKKVCKASWIKALRAKCVVCVG